MEFAFFLNIDFEIPASKPSRLSNTAFSAIVYPSVLRLGRRGVFELLVFLRNLVEKFDSFFSGFEVRVAFHDHIHRGEHAEVNKQIPTSQLGPLR